VDRENHPKQVNQKSSLYVLNLQISETTIPIPRFDARINIDPRNGGTYVNPFTGTTGKRKVHPENEYLHLI